jgi:hypothetical protein
MSDKQATSWRDILPIHPACEMLDPLSPDELETLGGDIAAHGLRIPIIIYREDGAAEPQLLDGRNRLDAMEKAGMPIVVDGKIAWRPGSFEWREVRGDAGVDPYAYVLSANIHRRHLTNEQKRNLIAKLLKLFPERSDLAIAKMSAVSDKTVASVRADLVARSEIRTSTTRTDNKGRQQRAHKPKPTASPGSQPPPSPRAPRPSTGPITSHADRVAGGDGFDDEAPAPPRRHAANLAAIASAAEALYVAIGRAATETLVENDPGLVTRVVNRFEFFYAWLSTLKAAAVAIRDASNHPAANGDARPSQTELFGEAP